MTIVSDFVLFMYIPQCTVEMLADISARYWSTCCPTVNNKLADSRSKCWSKSVDLVLFDMSAIMSTNSRTKVGRRVDPYNVREHRKCHACHNICILSTELTPKPGTVCKRFYSKPINLQKI